MNLAAALRASAAAQGDRTALVELSVDGPVRSVAFAELDDLVQRAAVGFRRAGVTAGDRVLVAVTPGVDLYVAVFGALCVGATAVFLDAQAARTTQVRALGAAAPAAVVAPGRLLRAAPVVPALRRTRLRVAIGGGAPGAASMADLLAGPRAATPICAERRDDDVAFVTYTSGSTGRPKGVPRTHGLLRRQHEAIQANFPMSADEVALVGFPMLGVHTLFVGCTAVLVPFDPRFDTAALAAALRRHAITSVGLGPAMWRDLLPVLAASPEPLPELRYVGTGGAPLSLAVARAVHEQFPTTTCYCAYGSAEAEPVARIELGRFIESATTALATGPSAAAPGGYPVGVPVPEVRVRVVAVGVLDPDRRDDDATDVEDLALPTGRVGEVVLAGDNVVDRYVGDPEATRATKVADPGGTVWHRTGDIGWFDDDGCLWLVGRVADRIGRSDGTVLDPYPLELALDELAGVRRSAVIAHAARPDGEVIVDERPGETVDVVAVARLLARYGLDIPIVRAAVPLDTRIRSKIDRVALRRHRQDLLGSGRRLPGVPR